MADPTQITQQQVGFAPEVAPYAQDLLGRAAAMQDIPYQAYEGDQIAQFSPLQQQSYDYASQLTSAPQLQDATAMAGLAGLGGLNTQYTFQPAAFSAEAAKGLMSPYMQNVVDVQQQQAKRQADIAAQTQQAQAARSGAFGGGRDAIMRSQANAELQRNLQGIQATGLQNAFQNAQQQFNTQNQLNAQQQQFGASLGMQGLQTALSGAQQLGNLGQTQYAQNVGLVGLQNQLGLQQQQQAQNVLNTQYQNYLNQQNYPYKQMGFMSDILRGVPLTTTGSTVYQAAPSALQSLTSLGLGAYGLSSLFGGTGTGQAAKAAGGSVKGYAGGGSVTSREFKEYAVDNVPSQLLPTVQRNAQGRGDMDTYQLAMEKMAQDAAIRRGVAGALPAGASVVRAAGGGILAFNGEEGSVVPTATTDESFLAALAGAQGEGGQTVEIGDKALYGDASRAALLTARKIADLKEEGYSPEQIDAMTKRYYDMYRTMGGDSPYGKLQAYLDETRAGGAENMRQAKGLAALKAASAVLQPGGTMRGLGAAGAAFGESYGKALQADQAEKRSLAQMQFHLDDAQRKERMGLTKDAMAATAAAVKAKKDVYTSNINKLKAQGDLEAKIATANRPIRIGGAGAGEKPLKINEQLAAAETAYENDPSEKNLKNVTALRRAVAQTKTTDVGTTKADLTREGRISSEDKSVQAAMKSFKYDPAYLEAKQAGPDEAERVWNAELERQRSIYRGPAGGGAGEQKTPKAAPKILKFNAKGELIPS